MQIWWSMRILFVGMQPLFYTNGEYEMIVETTIKWLNLCSIQSQILQLRNVGQVKEKLSAVITDLSDGIHSFG